MRTRGPGVERYIVTISLLIPVVVSGLLAAQVGGVKVRLPGGVVAYAATDASPPIVTRRPAGTEPAPPPTLAPVPTPTAVPVSAQAAPTATAVTELTYTVQPGDELKNIAAEYGVNIFKLIDANDIPNPDSLRVGQVLRIPN